MLDWQSEGGSFVCWVGRVLCGCSMYKSNRSFLWSLTVMFPAQGVTAQLAEVHRIIPVSIQSLTVSELLQKNDDFCDMNCSFLRSMKMHLNSFQVTTAYAFVLKVLEFENIRCLRV